jgi:hypothetical protein
VVTIHRCASVKTGQFCPYGSNMFWFNSAIQGSDEQRLCDYGRVRTKDANRSYFGAHNLVGENGIFSPKF